MEKPKKLTKKQRLELLEQKRAAKAYCDELAKRNEFDYGNCWVYACVFGRGWDVDEIYNYLRRYGLKFKRAGVPLGHNPAPATGTHFSVFSHCIPSGADLLGRLDPVRLSRL